ncbi:MAG: FHA domain-containing protein, partial [Acidobacteria bacterium]|nr:FHA domain-containing protein [Acidobacteriota bacterium]
MKIVLTGVDTGLANGEQKAFEQATISIGRDANDCDVIFPNDRFPMVSRHHAAISRETEGWVLTDQNSSYGTFLNGQRITRSRLTVGDVLQFGPNGPSMGIASFEDLPVSIPGGVSTNTAAEIRFPDNPQQHTIAIGQTEITFGRDPQSTVPFPANDRIVSRDHAAIVRTANGFVLEDRGSFNGTFLNDQRITAPTPLTHGDKIRFGTGGPTAEFFAPSQRSSFENSLANERIAHLTQNAAEFQNLTGENKTIVARLGRSVGISKNNVEPQLLMSVAFGEKHELLIGRAPTSDIRLDGLDISTRHARLKLSGGQVSVEDLGSTNGVYLNGAPTTSSPLSSSDSVQIGQFLIKIDAAGTIGVFDTRARMRIDASHLARSVRSKGGRSQLLDDISLTVQPNEFVGIIGPSGSGKTSLIHTLSGASRPEAGNVSVNGRDLYREYASLKHSIGLVPQDDIIHRELTVYRTLLYVAKLRLSRDVSRAEIDRTINEVLDVTGLLPRRDVRVSDLSGGQRKRVSVAVELITRPSLLFLDEPTSGLDPQTEFSMMELFRQIADSGRTVVITTHAAETVRMFDKIAVLM